MRTGADSEKHTSGLSAKSPSMDRMTHLRGTVAGGIMILIVSCQGPGPTFEEARAVSALQFQRFVGLEGAWRIVGGDHAQGATHTYHTIANGSVVVETAFPGEVHEMVTVVHLDGPGLVLTHYCAAGNQPHMVAEPSSGDEVRFHFVRASDLDSPEDAHMRDVSFTFITPDRFSSTWSFWEGGVQVEEMIIEVERISE